MGYYIQIRHNWKELRNTEFLYNEWQGGGVKNNMAYAQQKHLPYDLFDIMNLFVTNTALVNLFAAFLFFISILVGD